MTGDILDELFHGCAFHAYLEVWRATGQFPPDSEQTRRLAYQLYEKALAEKNGRSNRRPAAPVSSRLTPQAVADLLVRSG